MNRKYTVLILMDHWFVNFRQSVQIWEFRPNKLHNTESLVTDDIHIKFNKTELKPDYYLSNIIWLTVYNKLP